MYAKVCIPGHEDTKHVIIFYNDTGLTVQNLLS